MRNQVDLGNLRDSEQILSNQCIRSSLDIRILISKKSVFASMPLPLTSIFYSLRTSGSSLNYSTHVSACQIFSRHIYRAVLLAMLHCCPVVEISLSRRTCSYLAREAGGAMVDGHVIFGCWVCWRRILYPHFYHLPNMERCYVTNCGDTIASSLGR